jgi:hypothetical protein
MVVSSGVGELFIRKCYALEKPLGPRGVMSLPRLNNACDFTLYRQRTLTETAALLLADS